LQKRNKKLFGNKLKKIYKIIPDGKYDLLDQINALIHIQKVAISLFLAYYNGRHLSKLLRNKQEERKELRIAHPYHKFIILHFDIEAKLRSQQFTCLQDEKKDFIGKSFFYLDLSFDNFFLLFNNCSMSPKLCIPSYLELSQKFDFTLFKPNLWRK